MNRFTIAMLSAAIAAGASACSDGNKMGTYGYDAGYLASKGIPTIELKSEDGQARVLLAPTLQGRVMTSTTGGEKGPSFGWLNYKALADGFVNPQFNPFGGEERFWIGPEGGPFSWFFKPGEEQVYANWNVPALLDTEAYDVESASGTQAVFVKEQTLRNASGNEFNIGLRRVVTILEKAGTEELLGVDIPEEVRVVAYRTENSLINRGTTAWTKETGMPSVWILGMYPPTPTTTVFIPYDETHDGKIVNDEYFGKVPADRLQVGDGLIRFKIDGKYRSKIGLPAGSAKDICGSYDPEAGVLNILKYTIPEGECDYVNSQWGPQDDPYHGDVINSYNDGPTDTGTIMGPFYEIETSSPAAPLQPGQTLTHTQYTLHLQGPAPILESIFNRIFLTKDMKLK